MQLTMCKQEGHQEMRYPNVTSLYFDTPLAFNAPDGRGFPGTISVKSCTVVKEWLTCKMAENRAHNVTDDRQICDSKDPNVT